MPGKPYRSSLIPYEDEIVALRRRRPPMPYSRIAELLRQKYNFNIQRVAIFKFIKVRSRGRKVYSYSRSTSESKATPQAPRVTVPVPHLPAVTVQRYPTTVKFDFKPSERYNLTR